MFHWSPAPPGRPCARGTEHCDWVGRSLVARLIRDQEVVGSTPTTQTIAGRALVLS